MGLGIDYCAAVKATSRGCQANPGQLSDVASAEYLTHDQSASGLSRSMRRRARCVPVLVLKESTITQPDLLRLPRSEAQRMRPDSPKSAALIH